MKTLFNILMICLVIGLTNCKKENVEPQPDPVITEYCDVICQNTYGGNTLFLDVKFIGTEQEIKVQKSTLKLMLTFQYGYNYISIENCQPHKKY